MKCSFFLLFTAIALINVTYASFPVLDNSNNEPCDNIIFKNGNEISARIIEITPDLIKYRKCDNLEGPLISIYKNKVLMLRYNDGSKELFNTEYVKTQDENIVKDNEDSEVPVSGILSLSFSLFSLLITLPLAFGVLFAIVGFISGISSLDDKYWGLGLAGMIIGLIDLIIFHQLYLII